MSTPDPAVFAEPAPAKLNLALHVRGKRSDRRHEIETIFAFCTDGDSVEARFAEGLILTIDGPFADELSGETDNLVLRAARALAQEASVPANAALRLVKNLPVASGIGGGSADAASTLRVLTRMWKIDPRHSQHVAPALGSDVPACLLSLTTRGEGAGDRLALVDAGISGCPVLLVNPLRPLATKDVFQNWAGADQGPLVDWRGGRNDLETAAKLIVPEINMILEWFERVDGIICARMSGSGPTCFGLFEDEAARDSAAARVPTTWWHLATWLR
ncbi:MAG: 4-(cytidine 5'-diphospho)-2-C-methyl-D-erythritol kinase [Sphingomicrobium sp.]